MPQLCGEHNLTTSFQQVEKANMNPTIAFVFLEMLTLSLLYLFNKTTLDVLWYIPLFVFVHVFSLLSRHDLESYSLSPNFSSNFYASFPEAAWQVCWNGANASQMITHRVVCLLLSLSKHPWLCEIVLCCARSTFCPNACGFQISSHPSAAAWDFPSTAFATVTYVTPTVCALFLLSCLLSNVVEGHGAYHFHL